MNSPVCTHSFSSRAAFSVFYLSGLLMAFPGAILPAWGYHLRYDFIEIGCYFFAMIVGILGAVRIGGQVVERKGVRFTIVLGCEVAAGAFFILALAGPPADWGFRALGMAPLGFAAGILNGAAFQSLSAVYERDRAATVNLAGASFGLGCLTIAVTLWALLYVYTPASTLLLVGLLPALAGLRYARSQFAPPIQHYVKGWREVWQEVKSPGAILFSLLLFFQFGNEWAIAGWLAIFLVHRIGASPDTGLLILSFFWLSLLLGRALTQSLLPKVGHSRLLLGSVAAAFLGAVILSATNNEFGAWTSVLLLGSGFATIYPLVVERIGNRFPDYHPGFYNGVFSFALLGGLLAPGMLGFFADAWGIGSVMFIPLLGTVMVFLLVVLLWAEAKLLAYSSSR